MKNSNNYLDLLTDLDEKNKKDFFFHLNHLVNKQGYGNHYLQYLEKDNFQSYRKEGFNDWDNSFFSLDNIKNWDYLDYLDYLDYIKDKDIEMQLNINFFNDLESQTLFLKPFEPSKRKRRWDHILRFPEPIAIYRPLTLFKNLLLITFIGSLTIISVIILPDLNAFVQKKISFEKIAEIFKKIKNNIIKK